ncbi:MAG: GNAT family N-acetyltransferase, partial [Candidatus Limnocylindrales bacterium]
PDPAGLHDARVMPDPADFMTLPDARGRGLGRAITLAAMRHGAGAGAAIAVLQSSEVGYRLYRGLGFEDFGRYRSLLRSDD